VLQLNYSKSPCKTWREYYKDRFITDLTWWRSSMHDLKLWDDSCYNPYTPRTSVTPSQVFGFSPSLIRDVSKPMTGCHRDFRLSSGGHLPENKVADERAGEKSKNSEEKEANVGEGEEEGMEEMEEHQAKAIITRRKRRMLSKSASNSAGGSPATIPVQPPLPFIPYSPSVFPQAKRKAVAFIGPRGAGKATLFYLLKFGRMFRGVRYLRKFGGIVSLDIATLHCHLELEVWDITTHGSLEANSKIVPFYQLHGVILIVDAAALCQKQCAILREILQRIIDTPPACQTSSRKDSMAVVDYAWLFPPPVLVYANKCDLPNHKNAFGVATMLDLDVVLGAREAGSPLLKSGRWRVQGCSAIDGRGVIPGLRWLHKSMQANN